jgi:anti-anti-sigma factor
MREPGFELRRLDVGEGSAAAAAGAGVIEVRGEVDADNVADAESALAELAAEGPIVLDLSRAAYFDSAGFAMVYRLLGRAALAVVVSPDSPLRTAATLIGLPLHDDVAAAVDGLRSPADATARGGAGTGR